ncbi:2-dehydro-3-deoxygalactonokinase [Novosphingobium aquae]|uniref:2-dehydro-3-deoxygalactonokinase n=1 Tax=Novosphingobium aquae TaxID=3133435 RepID=A0ABU8SA52_9SPHN
MAEPFLAVDWGTTNRRVYRIEDGQVVNAESDSCGISAVSDFPAEVANIRGRMGDLPMLLAGMVGSKNGWRETQYVSVPAGIPELSANLLRIDDRTSIVPGLSCLAGQRPDVMRGEEVQLLGAAVAGLIPQDALLAQPGTHCKWARIANSAVVAFTTSMTGELFALLGKQSLLAEQLTGPVTQSEAFLEGVREGQRRDLAASLFGIRAAKMLGVRDDSESASYASGLLIGSDVCVRMEGNRASPVYVLANPDLGALYLAAIAENGGEAQLLDSHTAFAAGIIAIWEACS